MEYGRIIKEHTELNSFTHSLQHYRKTLQQHTDIRGLNNCVLRYSDLHLFSMNWCSRQDLPVPAFPITRNLNRKSEEGTQTRFMLLLHY